MSIARRDLLVRKTRRLGPEELMILLPARVVGMIDQTDEVLWYYKTVGPARRCLSSWRAV